MQLNTQALPSNRNAVARVGVDVIISEVLVSAVVVVVVVVVVAAVVFVVVVVGVELEE